MRPHLAAPRPQQDEAPPLTVTPPLPVQPTVAATLPPEPPSLAGKWTQTSNCPLDMVSHEWILTPSGREQYSITQTDSPGASGWVSGKIVHMQWPAPLSEQIGEGTVTSPTAMDGKIHNILFNCHLWVKKD